MNNYKYLSDKINNKLLKLSNGNYAVLIINMKPEIIKIIDEDKDNIINKLVNDFNKYLIGIYYISGDFDFGMVEEDLEEWLKLWTEN